MKPAASTMRYEGKAVLPFFGTMAADAITEDDCRAYRAARLAAGRKDGTIWTELGRLRSALKWAEKRGLIGRAPSIERPPIQPPRDLRLTREQAKAFLDACQMPHVRLFVILAMTTGARMGALLGLTWDRVDFDGGTIDLHDPGREQTKKRRPWVPMNATARVALSEARAGALTPYVAVEEFECSQSFGPSSTGDGTMPPGERTVRSAAEPCVPRIVTLPNKR